MKNSVKVPKILQLSSKFTNLVFLINLKSRKVLKKINLNEINVNKKENRNVTVAPYTMLQIDLSYKSSGFASSLEKISIVTKFFDREVL